MDGWMNGWMDGWMDGWMGASEVENRGKEDKWGKKYDRDKSKE